MASAHTNFAALIRDLRARLGLSQQQLATRLRVSFATIHRWEAGKSLPDEAVRHSLAQFVAKLGPAYQDVHAALTGLGTGSAAPASRRRRASTSPASAPAAAPTGDVRSMEAMLWSAACSIRGEKDAPKFKDYILPLIFLKRLSDVFEDELTRLETELGPAVAHELVAKDHSLVRFYLPPEATWPVLSGRRAFAWPAARAPHTRGEHITTALRAVARENPALQGVIDTVDFNETRNGEREISDNALAGVIETLSDSRYRLGLDDVEPDFFGRAYEYLLRKFAEGQGQSAGEFFTPKEVGWLIAYLMAPRPGETVYDPCCGSGGLLIKCQLALREHADKAAPPLQLFGQELTGSSYAIARMNTVVHDMACEILRGNTMSNPKFADGSGLRRFDLVVTNPMWNQSGFDAQFYESDPFVRFAARGGFAPNTKADWAWLQHVAASLSPAGRAAVVLDTGAASRGSGSANEDKEKAIRRWFVEHDLVEAVILLPDNLFYNTSAAGLIFVLNASKPAPRRAAVLMINAAAEFRKGRPKNELTPDGIQKIAAAFAGWTEADGFARAVPLAALAEADFNLSPSRFVAPASTAVLADIQTTLDELARLDAEARALDADLARTFHLLGFRWGGTP